MSHPQQTFSPPPPPSTLYTSTPPAPPPKPLDSATPPQGRPPPPPPPPPGYSHNGSTDVDNSNGYRPQPNPAAPTQIPPIQSDWLPEILADKSTQDLQTLLSDPSLQSALVSDPATTHPAITASEAALEPYLTANIALANNTLELESRLQELRAQTQSRLLALRGLKQQHEAKLKEAEAALWEYSPMALKQRLNASVLEQEQLLRDVEEGWLDEDGLASEKEVAELVRRVKEVKKLAFLRQERKARWDEARVGGWR